MRSAKTTRSEPKAKRAEGWKQEEKGSFPQQATGSMKPVVMFISSLTPWIPAYLNGK